MTIFIRNLIAIVLAVILFGACGDDGGGGGEARGVSGTFTIAGQSNHSGITVSIFNTNVVEGILSSLKNRFPQNGPTLNPALRFNHREFSTLASTTTSANGAWELTGIDRNSSYILVAEHSTVGFAYFFDIQGENNITESLNTKAVLDSNIFGKNLTFSNQVVDIVGDVFIDNASQINITGHCFFNFSGTNTLTSRASFSVAAGGRLTFLNSGSGTAEFEIEDATNVNLANFSVLEPVKLTMDNSQFSIEESAFLAPNITAIRMINGSASFNKNLFYNQQTGVSASQATLITGSRLMFTGNNEDVAISNTTTANFSDNLFHNGGLNLEYISTNGEIIHNHFESSVNNVIIADISTVKIENNHFENNDKNIWLQQISHSLPDVLVDANFNNFINTLTYAVQLENGTIPDSLNAINNFWNVTVEPDIQNIIWDKNDNPNGSNSLKYVKFIPYELQMLSGKGIR